MKDEQYKILDQLARMTWESLESHLPYTYGKQPKNVSKKFERGCVPFYAKQLSLIAKLYE